MLNMFVIYSSSATPVSTSPSSLRYSYSLTLRTRWSCPTPPSPISRAATLAQCSHQRCRKRLDWHRTDRPLLANSSSCWTHLTLMLGRLRPDLRREANAGQDLLGVTTGYKQAPAHSFLFHVTVLLDQGPPENPYTIYNISCSHRLVIAASCSPLQRSSQTASTPSPPHLRQPRRTSRPR